MEPLPRAGVGRLNVNDAGAAGAARRGSGAVVPGSDAGVLGSGAVVPTFDAVVLAGGRASRLGGYPKPQLDYGGSTLLEHALEAVRAARMTVVVGPRPAEPGGPSARAAPRPAPPRVVYALEEPRFGGPLAALGSGLAALSAAGAGPDGSPWTALLAADLPRAAEAVGLLLEAAAADPPVDGIMGQDESGRSQPLLALYRRGALERAVAGLAAQGGLADRPLRDLVASLDLLPLPLPPGLSDDVDTWEAAERWGIGRPESPGAAARREDPR